MTNVEKYAEATATYPGTELEAMAHVERYYRWIANDFGPYLGYRIVEVGAGIGTFSGYLRATAPDSDLVLVEPAVDNFDRLEADWGHLPGVRVVNGTLTTDWPRAGADTIVAVNVLEHIRNDAEFLAAAHGALGEGGRLLLWVPALPRLFGTLDEAFGHHRRYTRESLQALLEEQGFAANRVIYRNFPGTLVWWLAGRVLCRRTISARQAKLYDRFVIPIVSAIERRWNPPFGPSLLAIATRLPDGPGRVGTPPPHSPA